MDQDLLIWTRRLCIYIHQEQKLTSSSLSLQIISSKLIYIIYSLWYRINIHVFTFIKLSQWSWFVYHNIWQISSALIYKVWLNIILRGIVGKFCSRYCFDWQYYRHSGITLTVTTKHITLYAITKGNAKNNEIPSVCVVLISSLANINIIYAIDCSKIFFFVVWKKNWIAV